MPTHSVLAGQQGAHTLIDFIVGGRGRIPMLKWILPRLDTCKDFATIIRNWYCLIIKPLIVIGPLDLCIAKQFTKIDVFGLKFSLLLPISDETCQELLDFRRINDGEVSVIWVCGPVQVVQVQ